MGNSPKQRVLASARLAWPILSALRAAGADSDDLVARVGLRVDELESPEARIPYDSVVDLLCRSAAVTGDDAFGLHAAEHIRPGVFPLLEHLARSSSSMEEGLHSVTRNIRLLQDAAALVVEERGDRVILRSSDLGRPLPRPVAEFVVAGWVVAADQWFGSPGEGRWKPLEVWFVHAEPNDTREHDRIFGAPLHFGAEANALVVPTHGRHAPLERADSSLHGLLDRFAQQLLSERPAEHRLTTTVRELIARTLRDGSPSAQAIAERLRMSERTLRRRLREEGTTYHELLDELRSDLAARYLGRGGLSIGEVVYRLGFSDASAFHKAFKRWTGTTPAEYRRSVGPS